MTSFRSAVKLLGVGIMVSGLATGCIFAKKMPAKEEMAAAPEPEPAMEEKAMMENDSYVVVAGDCLWCISAKSQIYGDPYKWPLIYRKNASQIEDADLIFPGQELEIDRNLTPELISNATAHARNRGAWTLGVTEQSDVEYLSANP